MSIDHIIPQAQDGKTELANLCYACRRCNEFKGSKTQGIDPLTGKIAPIFHPRHNRWADHFAWEDQGLRIAGKTAIGRATVIALNMNNEYITASRRIWLSAGWRPLIED